MAYVSKVWVDRQTEYPTRRKLEFDDGSSDKIVTVSREEGTIYQPGDTFDANTMNLMESRIAAGIAEKQDILIAGNGIRIDPDNVISAISEGGGVEFINEGSGSVVSFNNGADNLAAIEITVGIEAQQTGNPTPMSEVAVTGFTGLNLARSANAPEVGKAYEITASQSGTGDPSPTNIRPIIPGLTLVRDDESILTVYDGYIDIVSRVLTATWMDFYFDGSVSVANVGYSSSVQKYYTTVVNPLTYAGINSVASNAHIISDKFLGKTGVEEGHCYLSAGGTIIVAILPDQTITTKEQATTWFQNNPTHFVYELAQPVTYQLSQAELGRAMTALGIDATFFPVSWEDTAGTIYGGYVNIITGELTQTWGQKTYTGALTESWGTDTSGNYRRFYCSIDDAYPGTGNRVRVLSNRGKFNANSGDDTLGTIFIRNATGLARMYYIPDQSCVDVASFRTWLSTNNLSVYYELNPRDYVTYTIDPVLIATLLGENNFFANSGNIEEMKYYTTSASDVRDFIIKDEEITDDASWSSEKIQDELDAKQDSLTAGDGIVFDGNEISAVLYKELTATLNVFSTSIVFEDSSITTSSVIDIYTSKYGFNPETVTAETGRLTLTFRQPDEQITVKVRIS